LLISDYYMSNWTLFSNHGHVLVCLARNPESRLRDVAAAVGITERAVQKIVRDLQDDGMVSITKHGRRNHYRLHRQKALRHDLEAHCTLSDLISMVNDAVSQSSPVSKTRSIEPSTVRNKPAKPASVKREPDHKKMAEPRSVKPGTSKVNPKKTDVAESIEKQQGSLF